MNFYDEFKKLCFSRPHNAISSRTAANCAFSDYIYGSKNIYLSWFLRDAQDCYYCEHIARGRDCVDCTYLSACELCYECTDCSNLYNCSFLQDCYNCSHCDFCFDCMNCKDCFGSFGLRHKQFCIFNKPYTEDVYRKKVATLKKNPVDKILHILRPEFDKHPRLYARQVKGGDNCYGDYIYFSKNCYLCFNVRNVENSGYVGEIMDPELPSGECYDCNEADGINFCYDCYDVKNCANCNFLYSCSNCSDSEYLRFCYNCQDCFGCAYLMNKQYCILNRQFTRDEYLLALKQIKEDLHKTGTHGKSLAEVLTL